jgi:hypothetical protein
MHYDGKCNEGKENCLKKKQGMRSERHRVSAWNAMYNENSENT